MAGHHLPAQPRAQRQLLGFPVTQLLQAVRQPLLHLRRHPRLQHGHAVCAHHPGGRQPAQRLQCLGRGMHRRNRVSRAHARHAQRFVGRPQLPQGIAVALRRSAFQPQRAVGAVQHMPGRLATPCRSAVRPVAPHGFWHPQGAGWLTGPVQARWRCCFTLCTATWVCLQPPHLGGLQIVAIVVLRQRDGRDTVAHGMLGQAVYQFTAAAANHDAFRRHAVKSRQLRTHIGVVRVGVLRAVRRLQRLHGRRAWPAGIAVGGKVMRGHAQRVGAAMHHGGVFRQHHPPMATE